MAGTAAAGGMTPPTSTRISARLTSVLGHVSAAKLSRECSTKPTLLRCNTCTPRLQMCGDVTEFHIYHDGTFLLIPKTGIEHILMEPGGAYTAPPRARTKVSGAHGVLECWRQGRPAQHVPAST